MNILLQIIGAFVVGLAVGIISMLLLLWCIYLGIPDKPRYTYKK